jgi:hypothetical protein
VREGTVPALGIRASCGQAGGVAPGNHPPGAVVLSRGQADRVDWELVYWPRFPRGPIVVAGIAGAGGGSHPSKRLKLSTCSDVIGGQGAISMITLSRCG